MTAAGILIPSGDSFDAYVKPNESATGDELLLHSSKHPRLDYTARQHKNSSSGANLKHYVAVYDTATGQVQVVEAHKVDMKASVRSEDEEIRSKARLDPPTVCFSHTSHVAASAHLCAESFQTSRPRDDLW